MTILLRWTRVRAASTTEVTAPSRIIGRTYTIARYDGQSRSNGKWRLTASDEEETLHWSPTLRDAKAVADAYEAQRVAAERRTSK